MSAQTYENLLTDANNFVKVKAVDTPQTIYLLNQAKGKRSLREFAAVSHTSAASICRILNGTTIEMGNDLAAGFVYGADPDSGVTLERMMDALGRVRKQDIPVFERNYQEDIKRIVIDELLNSGNHVQTKPSPGDISINPSGILKFTLEIIPPQAQAPITCEFEINTFPLLNIQPDDMKNISSWMNHAIAMNFMRQNDCRQVLVVDNPVVYQQMLELIRSIRVPNEIAVVLISPQERKVSEEYIIPLTDFREAESLFRISDKPGESPEVPKNESYFQQIYKKDCRGILTNELLHQGYRIRYLDEEDSLSGYEESWIQPDFIYYLGGKQSRPTSWGFVLQKFLETDETVSTERSIHEWVCRAFAYYYLGGKLSKLSLIVDNEKAWQYAIDEVSGLSIDDKISVIYISLQDRRIIREYRIPLSSGKEPKTLLF